MKASLKIVVIVLFLVFATLQVFRPDFTNPPVVESKTLESELKVPEEIASILERSCRDCHTNRTVYPWYANIQPVGWYLIDHVREGRRELNFSEWSSFSHQKKRRKLREICEQVESREMPLPSYLLIHREAVLSDEDIKLLCQWTETEIEKIPEE